VRSADESWVPAVPIAPSVSVTVRAGSEDGAALLNAAARRMSAAAGGAPLRVGQEGLLVDLEPGLTAVMRATREIRPGGLRSYSGLRPDSGLRLDAGLRLGSELRLDAELRPDSELRLDAELRAAQPVPLSRLEHWAAVWRRQPFTRAETAGFAAQLPLMSAVTGRLADRKPLSGHAVMITGHFLSDLIHLVDCLSALGAPLEAMTVLQKDYAYRLRDRVAGHLQALGVRITPSADAARAVTEHSERAAANGQRCLALDDGGYITPPLAGELTRLAARWDGVVEQTMSGIYRLEGIHAPFPVFSVAQSRLKGRVESYWIADAAVSATLTLLPPVKIEGQPALVIGYGSVGEHIAAILRGRRMRVAVHDTDTLRLIEAHEHGYLTGRDLTGLVRGHAPLLVFGATGRRCLSAPQFAAMAGDCFLASVSSRDIEFDLSALRALPPDGDAGQRWRAPSGARITLLADGRPVNFYESDSISNLHSDLVYAGMLVGAHAVGTAAGLRPPGVDPGWADAVLAASGLLDDYYDRYGPRPPLAGPRSAGPRSAGPPLAGPPLAGPRSVVREPRSADGSRRAVVSGPAAHRGGRPGARPPSRPGSPRRRARPAGRPPARCGSCRALPRSP
jgi:adenosylhomocysteinase